jgi:hypothetical protein
MKTVNDWLVTSLCVMITACGVIACTASDSAKAVSGAANYHVTLYTEHYNRTDWNAISVDTEDRTTRVRFIESETGKTITINGTYVIEKQN